MTQSSTAFLTTGDVAKLCGVNFRTVIRWIERGHLKAFQLPGRGDNRIKGADLVQFLHTHNLPIPDSLQLNCRRVLIVDDERSMAVSIQRVLKRQDFETMIATDGFAAGALLGSFMPAVMTLDMQMPGLHGMDVLRLVKTMDRYNSIRILVISGLGDAELQQALYEGADDVLEKPFDYQQLIDRVCFLAGVEPESRQISQEVCS